MIDRADLVDDAELASFAGRVARRDEFLDMVTGWTRTRTTQEIVDLAVAFRIPVAPIANPETLAKLDHFVQRVVFVESPAGVLAPRVPYRSDAITTRPPSEPPALGADNRRHPSAVRHPGHRPHRVLGRPGRHPTAGRPGRRRDQDRGSAPAGRHAVLRGPPARLGPVVGVGPGLPVQQQQQAGHQRRPGHRGGTQHRARAHCRKRSRRRELLAPGDGELRPGMGRGARGQPARRHDPDARLRPGRPVARSGRIRPDHGAGDGHGLDDRTPRGPAGDSARRLRPDRRPARRFRGSGRADRPRPRGHRHAGGSDHGGGGAERGGRDAGRILAQRNRAAPQ